MTDIAAGRAYTPAGEISPAEQRKVVLASSLGTVFEWYDFYLYGSLAAIIGSHFFSGLTESGQFIFALLAFAAGFFVRPFGAIVFGRLGDLVGRKYTFLITIMIMGLSTFLVGVLPGYDTIGVAAPVILIVLRLLQGLALGGEYGGAAIYVAEHAEPTKRGYRTSWIQTTATLGLFLSLIVILLCRYFSPGETAAEKAASFAAEYGFWRIPFLVSIVLLGVSVWIRMTLNESPVFKQMKEEGRTSKAPLSEAFGNWTNGRLVLIALFGLTAGQAVVWYTGQFYALFFLTQTLKVDPYWSNIMIAIALLIGTPFFVFFGWLSDKIGRKPIIMTGLLLAILTYYPTGLLKPLGLGSYAYPGVFEILTHAGNPQLAKAIDTSPVTVVADPDQCRLQFDPVGKSKFTSPCDVAKASLVKAGVPYINETGPAGAAVIKINDTVIQSYDAAGPNAKVEGERFKKELSQALQTAGYPAKSALEGVSWAVVAILVYLVFLVTMVYGPIAAMLVELFPTRIRYTAMSLPYHIGNGWFGGFLPITAFAIVASTGNIYAGLMYPVIVAIMTLVLGVLFLRETKGRDIAN
ncbi:MFS transporter [Rhodomicrobium sp. Az07]|uniref:MFS transporter n=1 Tax=Rhodomicrobium sp. Az07 TaxID=2839034 RepID=UPI001BE66343|nr:MFS transporter [Rhodomicrobium sp. Az07]